MTTINAYRFKELTFGDDKYILVERHNPSWRKIFPRSEKTAKFCKELSDLNNKICELEQELNEVKMYHPYGTDDLLTIKQINSMQCTINIMLKKMDYWQNSFFEEDFK